MAEQLATVGSCIYWEPLSVLFFSFGNKMYFAAQFFNLVQIAKEHGGIMRFIQVSCLGASTSSPSRMLRAKATSEKAVLEEIPEVELSSFGFIHNWQYLGLVWKDLRK